MGVRKPSNRGGVKKFIGKFPSFRLKRIIWFESLLERDYLYHLEFDHLDVISFHEQPCRILYRYGNKKYRYTPDFCVVRQHKRQIVEVKPEEKAFDKIYRIRYEAAMKVCEKEGYEFIVVTDTVIRMQPQLDNIKLLIKYQRVPIHPAHQILCQEFFGGRREAAFGEVAEFLIAKGVEPQGVYSLVRWGILAVDLGEPLEVDSVVTLPKSDLIGRLGA